MEKDLPCFSANPIFSIIFLSYSYNLQVISLLFIQFIHLTRCKGHSTVLIKWKLHKGETFILLTSSVASAPKTVPGFL